MQHTKDSSKSPVTHFYLRFFLLSVLFCSILMLTACGGQTGAESESSAGQTISQGSKKESSSNSDKNPAVKPADETSNEETSNQETSKTADQTSDQTTQQSSENPKDASESSSAPETSEGESSSSEPAKTTCGEPNPDEKVVYITIDDGPSSNTSEILDILDQYDAKATWFVTNQYMQGDELSDTLKEIHDRGHAVGVHTFSHRYKDIYKSVDAYMSDYDKMNTIIVNATGEDSGIFRFPGGSNASYNKKIRTELLKHVKSEGLVYYDWNAFTGDTDGLSRSGMVSKAVKESSYNNKTILLMHDVPNKTTVVEALPEILSSLKDKGYEFRALDKDVKPIQFEK